MKEYLVQNPIAALVFVVVVVAIAIFLLVKIMQTVGMKTVRKTVYKAFVVAERAFRHGENQEKFEYVVRVAKDAIPAPFNLFITEDVLRKIIQTWFDLCKDLLDDGRLNRSEQAPAIAVATDDVPEGALEDNPDGSIKVYDKDGNVVGSVTKEKAEELAAEVTTFKTE